MDESQEKMINDALETPEGRRALAQARTYQPEWMYLDSIDKTLKNIEKALSNLSIDVTPKWGPKITTDQFKAIETVIKENVDRNRK